MYTYNKKVLFSDVDATRKMSFGSLMDAMQDCVNINSESVGRGIDYMLEHKRTWFAIGWNIEIRRIPKMFEEISVKTWAYEFATSIGYRNVIVTDENGEDIVCADSMWTLMDMETKHPVRIEEEDAKGYEIRPRYPMERCGRKIRLPKEFEVVDTVVVPKADIDYNGHMSNAKYILLANGDSDDVYMVGKIASFQIQNLLVAYKERFDKDNFIKNLLLDNLLLVDIYNRAKKLHIDTEVRRVVFIVETNRDKDGNELERIRGIFGGKTKDFVTAVDEKNIIVVKEVGENEGYEEMNKTAEVIVNLFRSDSDSDVHVAYGTIVGEIKEVSRSYKEARMALDVGKIFFEEKDVIAYSTLGIGRLIYQLPIPLCKMFIKEIFDGKSPDEFDEETLTTINKFFENSLNVSETSRQLYIHRNTLVYRLDKLQKATGLDLRVFEDAITFKIALMVVKYMKYMESLDY